MKETPRTRFLHRTCGRPVRHVARFGYGCHGGIGAVVPARPTHSGARPALMELNALSIAEFNKEGAVVIRAIALMVLAIGLAAPAYADTTDDAFIANLNTSGMNYGAPERAIQVAQTVVCGRLSDNPNTSSADLIAKVTSATNCPMVNDASFTGAAIQAYCPQYGALDLP